MKIKTLIHQLFKWMSKQEPAKSSLPVLEAKVNKLPIMRVDTNARQIQADAASLLSMLMNNGYEPGTILLLLGSMYGIVMGNAPEHPGIDETGKLLDAENLEVKFFELCTKERIVRKAIIEGAVSNVINIDRSRMN